MVGLPSSPAPANALSGNNGASHAANYAQLQPPPEIVATSRHERQQDTPAAARSIPLPKAGRYVGVAAAATTTTQPPASMSLPAQHFHPMQRTRTSASEPAARDPPRGHNAWEDSTVASMFGDNESRAASDRAHTRQGSHGRHYSDAAYQRQQHQQQPHHPPPPPQVNRAQQPKHDENLPFVIGENGVLKVIAPPAFSNGPTTAPITGSIPYDSVKADDLYQDDRGIFETPTKNNALRRTRLPYRETREHKNSSNYSPGSQYSLQRADSFSMSPERAAEAGEHLEQVRIEERRKRDLERQREREQERQRERERELEKDRELQHKRSTVFENLTPVEFDEPTFDNTRGAVIAPTSGVDPDELTEALQQRTPRAIRQFPPPQVLPLTLNDAPLGRTNSTRRVVKELAKQQQQQPSAPVVKSLKRRQSLDYNDAELHAMSYSDLRSQAFDFDPQTAALQQTAVPPSGGTIEDRLDHYKNKGSIDQHQFFTRISIEEWDEAGDWFLEQFSSVVQKMKTARKNKRRLVAQFEEEISAREEAVRGKIEGIGRTLEDLKQEGQTMMEGKDMDLEF